MSPAVQTGSGKVPAEALSGGVGGVALEAALRRLAETQAWNLRQPLPTTRDLGERYRVSNATVCRLLVRLSQDGLIWRRSNGRYFLNESRRVFESEPYACLVRKLQTWSRVYQGIMSGFSQAFGRDQASMLFVHNETLVRHADTAHPPVHAGPEEQRAAMAEFFTLHHARFRGILLDEVWRDSVLQEFAPRLGNAVIVCRPTSLPRLSSVSTDFDAAALLAVGHLYARGFDEIWVAVPFGNLETLDLLHRATMAAATTLGRPIATKNVVSVATPAERDRFIARIKATRSRIGVFCLEDNITLVLQQTLGAAGLAVPGRVGLLSGMGTGLVAERNISSLHIDYEKIGRAAGEILVSGRHRNVKLAPELMVRGTT